MRPVRTERTPLRDDLKDLMRNRPWWILLGAGIAALIFNSIRDGAAVYYFKYYVQTEQTFGPDGTAISLTTLFLVLGQAANIAGILLVTPVSNRVGKKNAYLGAMAAATVLSLAFWLPGSGDIWAMMLLQVLISMCAGSIFPLLWSMYADIADYSELRTGRRATGLIFSSSSMSQKFGWTLGGAPTGWLLGHYGFEANAMQEAAVQNGIRAMMSLLPAAGTVLSVLFIACYPLGETGGRNRTETRRTPRPFRRRRRVTFQNADSVPPGGIRRFRAIFFGISRIIRKLAGKKPYAGRNRSDSTVPPPAPAKPQPNYRAMHKPFDTLGRLSLCAAGLAPAAAAGQQPAAPPNVIIIYADDLGFGDLSCNGSRTIATPNADRAAREGVRFTNVHTVASTSTPARYGLLTGQYPWRKPGTGIAAGDAGMIISPEQYTLADLFKSAGYVTGAVGKWHLGLGERPGSSGTAKSLRDCGTSGSTTPSSWPPRATASRAFNRESAGREPRPRRPDRRELRKTLPGEPTGRDNPELLRMTPSPRTRPGHRPRHSAHRLHEGRKKAPCGATRRSRTG